MGIETEVKELLTYRESSVRERFISDHLLLGYHITIQNSRKFNI